MDDKILKDLILRCQKGETSAFEELYDLYGKKIFNIILKLISNYHDANDLTQEVFIKIYKSIDKFKGNSSLWSWIYVIISNSVKDYFRKNLKNVALSIDNEDEETGTIEIIDESNFVENILMVKYQKELVNKAISQLGYNHKEIILLKEIYDYSYSEIALMLQISEGTVKSRLNRARENLKKILCQMEQS